MMMMTKMTNSTHHQERLDEPAQFAGMRRLTMLRQLELKLTGSKTSIYLYKIGMLDAIASEN
jgi:hypothetical protein